MRYVIWVCVGAGAVGWSVGASVCCNEETLVLVLSITREYAQHDKLYSTDVLQHIDGQHTRIYYIYTCEEYHRTRAVFICIFHAMASPKIMI